VASRRRASPSPGRGDVIEDLRIPRSRSCFSTCRRRDRCQGRRAGARRSGRWPARWGTRSGVPSAVAGSRADSRFAARAAGRPRPPRCVGSRWSGACPGHARRAAGRIVPGGHPRRAVRRAGRSAGADRAAPEWRRPVARSDRPPSGSRRPGGRCGVQRSWCGRTWCPLKQDTMRIAIISGKSRGLSATTWHHVSLSAANLGPSLKDLRRKRANYCRRSVKLPIRTWISNAAAVFWGQHGAVTEQAEQSQCSRETVYRHARKVEERLEQASRDQTRIAEQDAKIERLVQKVAELEAEAQRATILDPFKQRRLATTACAMGLSTRQTEDLFQVLLPPGEAPDHSTIGRWVNREALKARRGDCRVLAF